MNDMTSRKVTVSAEKVDALAKALSLDEDDVASFDKLTDHLTEEQFSGYAASTLSPEEQAQVDSHLATCPLCVAEMELLITELEAWLVTGPLVHAPMAPVTTARAVSRRSETLFDELKRQLRAGLTEIATAVFGGSSQPTLLYSRSPELSVDRSNLRPMQRALARTMGPQDDRREGRTKDGFQWIAWPYLLDPDSPVLVIEVSSQRMELKGTRLQLRVGGWHKEVALSQIAVGKIGFSVEVPQAAWQHRGRARDLDIIVLADRRLFGTDGIYGRAGEWPLTSEFTQRLGRAIGQLARQRSETPVVVVGRDTRRSGTMLESALLAGMMAQGADVMLLDEFTTPGVSFLTAHMNATFGVVISASHNPYWDNGVKVFNGNGFKASDELELQIEQLALDDSHEWIENGLPGTVQLTRDLGEAYVSHLLRAFGGPGALRGLRVVLDCANGAASYLAPEVFRRLGAEVVALNVWPDGVNINVNCGTEGDGPRRAGLAVTTAMADIGFVFDGDADRCKFLDETGVERDGDYILAILARDLLTQGKLAGNTVVTTQMANLGLDLSLREIGVRLERTQAGDKWVSQRMRDGGYVLGGEQSGHIILFEHGLTTGDGLYSALRMSRLLLGLRSRGQRFSDLATSVLTKATQVLVKAEVPAKPPLDDLPAVQAQIQHAQEALGPNTLINVHYSGTEPVVRVMIQSADRPVEELQSEAQAILHESVASVMGRLLFNLF